MSTMRLRKSLLKNTENQTVTDIFEPSIQIQEDESSYQGLSESTENSVSSNNITMCTLLTAIQCEVLQLKHQTLAVEDYQAKVRPKIIDALRLGATWQDIKTILDITNIHFNSTQPRLNIDIIYQMLIEGSIKLADAFVEYIRAASQLLMNLYLTKFTEINQESQAKKSIENLDDELFKLLTSYKANVDNNVDNILRAIPIGSACKIQQKLEATLKTSPIRMLF